MTIARWRRRQTSGGSVFPVGSDSRTRESARGREPAAREDMPLFSARWPPCLSGDVPAALGFVAVSAGNTEVVQANSRAFSQRDVESMLSFYAPDAVVIDRRPVGWGEFRGHDALRSYYQGLFDNVASVHEDLSVVSEDGAVVVAACLLTAELAGQPDA